ncbi:efflux transporter outer membrane subunit [Nitratidesulfovibrio sp. 1201_IL3209]|uniref:efflux transporter outer membrane subunit n=1 Tax=Nitratidesulfovibrio sp. 1201_IL3209 TaxID=3084053 RepID=UPI002FDB94B7
MSTTPMRRAARLAAVAALAALALAPLNGCSLIPEYHRPAPDLPAAWNAGAAGQASLSAAQPQDWRQVVADAPMARLIDLALSNNRDLRVAVLQIEKARAQHAIARADLFPHIDASGGADMGRTSAPLSTTGDAYTSHAYSVGVGFSSFELDLFGRIRSLKEQALEQYLSTDAAARSVQLTLVAEVGQAYLTLAADREQLDLAREILETERASFAVVQSRYDNGIAGELDVAQAQTTVDTARVNVAAAEARVTADENTLALLLGMPLTPDLAPARKLADVAPLADVPAGLPSEVLARRPDVVEAEHSLKAANANIGAARAEYFPRIGLTASYGNASTEMNDLFRAGSRTWSFVPQATLPIFHAGAIRAGVESAEAERDIQVAQYEKTVQTAFKEVSDALAQGTSLATQAEAQASLVRATGKAYDLSTQRYERGVDGYLSKLDAQRSHATARQTLISVLLSRQSNRLTLFKALGGGWNGEPMPGTGHAQANETGSPAPAAAN